MIIISFIIGGTIGAFGMALLSVNGYERGYGDGKQDREIG
jgi:hypothetical protein